MSNSYKGFNNQILTFKKGTALEVNKLATMGSDGTAVTATNKFIGVVDSIRGEVVGIQLEGYVEVSYSGTTPTFGRAALKADSNGSVSVETSGTSYYTVIHIDTTNKIVGFIL